MICNTVCLIVGLSCYDLAIKKQQISQILFSPEPCPGPILRLADTLHAMGVLRIHKLAKSHVAAVYDNNSLACR